MDLVPPAQKNVVRIRTFKDDVLRAQGSTVQSNSTVAPTEKPITQVQLPTSFVASPLTQKNYTPLPNPRQTSSPLPKGDRPSPRIDPVGVARSNPVPPKASDRPVQALDVSLSEKDIAQIAHVQKASILSDEDTLHSEQSLGEGTIVRDIKRKRFKLLPAIATAVSSWFSEAKIEYQQAVTGPVHTVAKAESRLETIRKAIEQDKQAPKDDFAQVSASLKIIPRTQVQSAVIVKEKSKLPSPTWNHVVDDPAVLPVEDTVVSSLQIDIDKSGPVVQELASVEMRREVGIEETYIEPTPVPQTVTEITPEEPYQEVVVDATYIEPTPAPQMTTEVVQQNSTAQTPRQYAPARAPSEKPFYIALASIVFVATLLGVGVSYYFFGKTNTGVTQKNEIVYEAPLLFTSNATTHFLLPGDRLTLLSVLMSGIEENGDGVVHLYPTISEDRVPADIESVLTVLGPRAPGAFLRGVREIGFGGAYGKPFIVLTTTSFDTAFSGMLLWEEAMSADLSPLYGSPVFESYNPEVRTNTQTSAAFFKDIIASNKNARLLVDENGDDRIIYTFIDQNTIVITTTREALSDIIPLLK